MLKNLTVLMSDKFIGKKFTLKDGAIHKTSITKFRSGKAISAYAPDAETLKDVIETLQKGANLCLGVMPAHDTAKVVTDKAFRELRDKTGVIARTTDHLVHPDCAGWLLIDFDDDWMPDALAKRIDALGGVLGALRHIWPELSDAEMLVRGSSSNGVYADGVDPQASSGLHVYVLIKDPANTVKALAALQRRAWAEGLGWIKPSKSGVALVRSIVDASVGTSNRIAFEAPPKLGKGVSRLPDEIQTQTGQALDALIDGPDVTDQIEAEKARMRPVLDDIKEQYIRDKGKEVAKKQKITPEEGETIVREVLAQDGGQVTVPKGMTVYDRNGAVVSAEALVSSVRKGDQFGLPDPIEGPSYGRTTATLVWSHKYDAPILVSHAHGAKTIFRLPDPPMAAIWKIKSAKLKNRKRDTLAEVLSKVTGLDDIDKLLAVAVAQSNRVPHVMSGRDVMTFIDEHLPDDVIGDDWIKAIEGRIRWTLKKRKAQALAPTRFSADTLSKAWVDHKVVDELSPLDRIDGVTVIRAPMASGKTQRVGAPWVRDVKAAMDFGYEVWAVAHRVSLIGEMAHRLDLAHYQHDGFQTVLEKGGVGVCLPSITLKKYAEQKPEYIFVDEIRQVLEFLGAEAYCRTKEGTAANVFDRFVEIVRDAKGVLSADAGADDTVLQFLRMCRPDDQIRVIEMRSKPTEIKGTVLTGEHCQDQVVDQAAFAMQIGAKVWFACEGTVTADAVGRDLGRVGKVLVLTADNKSDAAQKAFLEDPEGQSRLYDAVVASPIISSGISIEHQGKPHFNAGFALFSGGAIRPTDAAQMLRRVRYLKDWTIGLTSLNRFGGCRAEDIIEGKVAAADLEGFRVDPSDFDKLVVGFEAEAQNQRGDFGAGLWWLLQDAGWTLTREHAEGLGDLVDVKKVVMAERDQQIMRASYWLTKAVERFGEVQVANTIENARKKAPAVRTRRRIDAWVIMDTIGLRQLTLEDLDWWRDGGRATAARYADLICRNETIDVEQVTLAHRALRLARRKHYIAMLGDWNPLADDVVLSEEVAEQALKVIWPRRKEFAASGAVPETWRNMKNKPKNARAAMRNVLLRCGLWFERKQIRCHRNCDSEIYGFAKSGDRIWCWTTSKSHLAQMRDRHAQIQDRDAQRQRALVVASEQADQTQTPTLKAGLDSIEARRRADDAANEAAKALDRIVKSGGTPPPILIYRGVSPEFLPSGVSAEDLFAALCRRGVPAMMTEP